MTLTPLPIDKVLPELLAVLGRSGAVVLTAPPGSGKTTRVPAGMLDQRDALAIDGEIWVLQPRRIAARSAARRVAFERGGQVGAEVGYQVRHDRAVGPATRLRFVTEGILARTLVTDPFLPGIGAVVLDEFHQRSLESDLALAMLAEVRATVREDLRIVVMSATLDPAPIQTFLEPCGVVDAPGSLHPVRVEHLGGQNPRTPADLVAPVSGGVRRALAETGGDVLVFLPGVGEIRRTAAALAAQADRDGVAVLPLHGQLPAAEQDAAIVPGPRRKVVLATNVAETSITIDGVTAVVDTGMARILRHDAGRGLDRLELTRISRAAAEQRRGRAGRTAPGVCFRLWSVAEERGMPEFELPEIRRLDLAGLALQVWAFAARPPAEFGWFEAPEPGALARADDLLRLLGAVDQAGLTPTGRAMLQYPLHPRLARMMEEGVRRGCPRAAAELAALLAERDIVPVGRGSGRRPADIFSVQELLHEMEAARFDPGLGQRIGVDPRAARAVAQARDQLVRRGGRDRGDPTRPDLIQTLLAGYPDRVSRRRDVHTVDGVMATGRGCRLTVADHEDLGCLFLALQVRESGGRSQARSSVDLACLLEEPWLEEVFPGSIRETVAAVFHGEKRTATAVHRRLFGQLVLEERIGGRPDPESVAALFATELDRDPWRVLGEQADLRGFLARVDWLRNACPDAGVPDLGDADVIAAAVAVSAGMTRLSELARAKLLPVLRQQLPRGIQALLDTQAPERIRLPSGRRVPVDYTAGGGPHVAARLQEFFGLAQTPRLGGGRVPLLLHLLGPNHRPVQITQDLASFWANTYPGVRSELKRRYPRHAWPEDPLKATPESRPQRRR